MIHKLIFLLSANENILPKIKPNQESLNQNIFQDKEFISQTKEGKEIVLSFSCSWMKITAHDPPEFVYIGRDITDQKQADQAFMPREKPS
ncbi:hypothetical protein [Planktothricoides raciborskii]|uniref:PAC domain-containing protein n=2 Tax=Planktothricoides raciborskii TaxID=132608 RepID=A0AAU8JCM3_9CYAN|nr:hypothetical protein [Planktothricoides raciborskii]KOR35708.1 hypothetical protein AM228_16810 [Planktothricoides sp. SR001]MBD2545794.1 hypothetical protein [Planktothricoides raciborskii FACHB-1370]MBD2583985.1 hypothetical protein [Planktothricoides raciborskii FACHB-1261]